MRTHSYGEDSHFGLLLEAFFANHSSYVELILFYYGDGDLI